MSQYCLLFTVVPFLQKWMLCSPLQCQNINICFITNWFIWMNDHLISHNEEYISVTVLLQVLGSDFCMYIIILWLVIYKPIWCIFYEIPGCCEQCYAQNDDFHISCLPPVLMHYFQFHNVISVPMQVDIQNLKHLCMAIFKHFHQSCIFQSYIHHHINMAFCEFHFTSYYEENNGILPSCSSVMEQPC